MQLYDLRVEIKDALRSGSHHHNLGDSNVTEQRDEMKQILLDLKQNQASYNVPSDDRLHYELKQ